MTGPGPQRGAGRRRLSQKRAIRQVTRSLPPQSPCTNFLSQILKTGDWQEPGAWPGEDPTSPKEWFYGDLVATTTYTWAAAHNWIQFARERSGRVTGLTNAWHMGIADVLQIDSDSNGNISHS
ncbi:amidase domain-containing protein [Nonomuraea sp. KM88]|uniref:amidase domain-containing protein n=1 Tax=Nonomuraea sp. KM88 TaxID=3457427 RepID=UPI003FCDA1B8